MKTKQKINAKKFMIKRKTSNYTRKNAYLQFTSHDNCLNSSCESLAAKFFMEFHTRVSEDKRVDGEVLISSSFSLPLCLFMFTASASK